MRICSFLPSGTEILYALGLGDAVVGVSHECDYPPDARHKPIVVRTVIDAERASSEEIDQAVRASLARRESLYQVDVEALRRARPDLIVTQELCDVCAVDATQVTAALRSLPCQPQTVSLHPHTLEESLEDIRRIGEATGRRDDADALWRSCRERLARLRDRLSGITHRPRVFCLEWLRPLMASGHWVPEMVELSGGRELLGRVGEVSRVVTADEVAAARPERLVLMPCGFSIERTRSELSLVTSQPWWETLPAVRDRQVYLVNGPAYFNRPGPRLIDGVELLAGLFHPETCADLIPRDSVLRPD